MASLDEYRQRIDSLDGEIVRLLNERFKAAVEIGRLKHESNTPVYVPAREKQVFEKVKPEGHEAQVLEVVRG